MDDHIGTFQHGGVVTIVHKELAGKDYIGLGRWAWYMLEGEPGNKT